MPRGNCYDLTSALVCDQSSGIRRDAERFFRQFIARRSTSGETLFRPHPYIRSGRDNVDTSGRDTPVERHAMSAGDRSLGPTRFGRLALQTDHFLRIVFLPYTAATSGKDRCAARPPHKRAFARLILLKCFHARTVRYVPE